LPAGQGWGPLIPGAWVRSLSQEHGIVRADPATFAAVFGQLQVGDLVTVIPVHSCLTADVLKRYLTLDGEWIEMMPVNY
jgi:D-serine deaminase-like pyridoxal phosphate-dependent protein